MSEEANVNDEKFKIQDPDKEMKPRFPKSIIPEVVGRLYGLKVTDIKELPSYDDLNFLIHASDVQDNKHIAAVNKDGYVLKILNSLQSTQPVIIDAQHALCSHVRDHGIPTQVPIVNKEGTLWSMEKHTDDSGIQHGPYLTRLVTYIPGTIFVNTPYIPGSFYNVGIFAGKLSQAMMGFNHSYFDDYVHLWSLTELPAIRDFLDAVTNSDDLRVVKEVTATFEQIVIPRYSHFRKSVIHGDINEQNLIMKEIPDQSSLPRDQQVHDVAALLDFSDVTKSYSVMDIAICIAYLSIECPKDGQIDAGGHILGGYLKVCDLNEMEFKSLKILVCARLCQSLVYGAHSYAQQPENTYLLTTSKQGWPLLHKLWSVDEDVLFTRWREIIKGYDTD